MNLDRPTRYREIILSGIHKCPSDSLVTLREIQHHFRDPKSGLAPAHRVLRNAWADVRKDTQRAIIDGDVEAFTGRVLSETLRKDGECWVSVVDEKSSLLLGTLPTRLVDMATRVENVDRAVQAAAAKAAQQGDRGIQVTATALQSLTRVGAAQVEGMRELADVLREQED